MKVPSDADGFRSSGEGEANFGVAEALNDLERAQREVTATKDEVNGLSASNRAQAAEVSAENMALSRLLTAVGELLAGGQPVPAGLAVSATVRVELVQEAARQAVENADAELKGIMKGVLARVPKIGKELLSMNLHLFPVKEWKLGGEASALFLKGTIEVTFGRTP